VTLAQASLHEAERLFLLVYEEQSIAAQRVRELLTETRTWLGEYSDELRSYSQSDFPAERGTGHVVGKTPEWWRDVVPDGGAGQSETGSPKESQSENY
jgi:hypothetical protein